MFGRRAGLPTRLGFRRRGASTAAPFSSVAVVVVLATQTFAQTAPVPPIERRTETFAAQVEAKRKELGVVGASIVVAQGDRILHIAGFGRRNLDTPAPVTADTVFPIASVTKQFTAVAVALAVGEGRLTFEDHPRRFVPEFRLKDPEADAKLDFIDLLAHRSGLGRSDFTFLFGSFTQDELFRLAGRAVPAARFREKSLYNNTMVSLAGAALARAYGTSYERFMDERILAPLGMRASTWTLQALAASPDHAAGYTGSTAGGTASAAAPTNLAAIAPAGALNSTARDMGAWLRFLNAHGQAAGLRVAPAAYARIFERHSPDGLYGLGFQLERRSGLLLADHGGNIPGYSAVVVHVPEKALSFALLTNQTASALTSSAKDLFWETVVRPELPPAPVPAPAPRPAAGPPIAPERLVGRYFSSDDLSFDVRREGGGLALILPGTPPLALKPAGVNLYDLEGSGGFAMSVAESQAMPGRIEAALRKPPSQSGGDIPLLKKDAAWLLRARAQHAGAHAALIGSYDSPDKKLTMEIVPSGAGVALLVVGNPPRLLTEAEQDIFRIAGRPETHSLRLRRGTSGSVVGFTLVEPSSSRAMIAEGVAAVKDPVRGREILERAAAAAGGAEAIDRIASMRATGRAIAAPHGLDGPTEEIIVPGRRSMLIELGAFGKAVIRTREITGARSGYYATKDGVRVAVTGKALQLARLSAVPHALYRWKERYAAVTLVGETVVNGENAYIVEAAPPGLAPTKLYISARSHVILREEPPFYFGDVLTALALGIDYSDYRTVNGIRFPFAIATEVPMLGRIVLAYETVTLDGPVDPAVFE